jgi:hypothetical protein
MNLGATWLLSIAGCEPQKLQSFGVIAIPANNADLTCVLGGASLAFARVVSPK